MRLIWLHSKDLNDDEHTWMHVEVDGRIHFLMAVELMASSKPTEKNIFELRKAHIPFWMNYSWLSRPISYY